MKNNYGGAGPSTEYERALLAREHHIYGGKYDLSQIFEGDWICRSGKHVYCSPSPSGRAAF